MRFKKFNMHCKYALLLMFMKQSQGFKVGSVREFSSSCRDKLVISHRLLFSITRVLYWLV